MKKPITVTGWAAKSFNSKEAWDDMEPQAICVYRCKGKKEDWGPQEWPPIKVTVTVEEIDYEH